MSRRSRRRRPVNRATVPMDPRQVQNNTSKNIHPKDSDLFKILYEKGRQEGIRSVLPSSLTYYAKKNHYPPTIKEDLSIHAFISAKNEESTIKDVIKNTFKAGVQKIIVVANGCSDNTASIARDCGAEVLEYKQALGYDIGRAIGIQHCPADINLVLDADFILSPKALKPFLYATANGVDIALNDLNPLYSKYAKLDKISILKYALNFIINRDYLGINSLTAVPHALSRKAIELIKPRFLAVPPKALVMASFKDLNIQAVTTVDVFKPNVVRPEIHKNNGRDLAEDLIIGDHLEAIHQYLINTDWRGSRTDLGRKRELINE